MAMGAPLSGTCYLHYNDRKLKLSDGCGGPVTWNGAGDKVALPIWTKQKNQRIAVVDLTDLTMTTFKKVFSVLHCHYQIVVAAERAVGSFFVYGLTAVACCI